MNVRRPAGVTVIAVLGIIDAVIHSCGLVGMVMQFSRSGDPNPLLDAMERSSAYRGLMMYSAVLMVIMCLMLWYFSINSLSLRPSARKGMLAFAWLSIFNIVTTQAVQLFYIVPFVIQPVLSTMPANVSTVFWAAFWLSTAFSVLLNLSFAIAILIVYRSQRVIDAFAGIGEPLRAFPVQLGGPQEPGVQ